MDPGTRHGLRRSTDGTPGPLLPADGTFGDASALVLDYLHDQLPLAVWVVTRVENGRQTTLYVDDEDNTYDLAVGSSHAWADSFCIHMAAGTTPPVTTDARQVPEYAEAAARHALEITSYGAAVINGPDGSLFGAICGFDPQVRDDTALQDAGPLLQMLGQMLGMVLVAERRRDQYADNLLRAQLVAETDALTGLCNRHAWHRLIAQEQTRLTLYADPLVAVMVDLDRLKQVNDTRGHAAGDEYIRAAAGALTRAVRSTDVVARLGGDEFGVLLPGCTEKEAPTLVDRIYGELDRAGVDGSVGWAAISARDGFEAGLAAADGAMYAAKATRRAKRELVTPSARAGS